MQRQSHMAVCLMEMKATRTLLPLVVLTATLLGPPAASAQDQLQAFLSSLEARPELKTTLQPALDAARGAGLPTRYLVAKAKEGLAKRVPPAVIARVLRQLAGQLAGAKRLLPAGSGDPLIETTGRALHAGVRGSEVKSAVAWLATDKRPGVTRRALGVLTDLRELGLSSGAAFAMLTGLAGDDPGLLVRPNPGLQWALRRVRRESGARWPEVARSISSALESGTKPVQALNGVMSAFGLSSLPKAKGLLKHGQGPADGLRGKAKQRNDKAKGPPPHARGRGNGPK